MAYGFGTVPFGQDGFGDNGWSRYLYDQLITPLRQADAEQGLLLRGFTEALRPILDGFRRKLRDIDAQVDPMRVRTAYSQTSRLRLGAVLQPVSPALQRGYNGEITALRYFTDRSLRLTQADIGRVLELDSPTPAVGRIQVVIFEIINTTTARISKKLPVDAGPIVWILRNQRETPDNVAIEVRGGDVRDIFPGWELFDGEKTFKVQARRMFGNRFEERTRLIDAGAEDGTINSLGQLVVEKYVFTQQDVGKPVQIVGSAKKFNNARHEIKKIISDNVVEFVTPAEEDATPFTWSLLPWPLLQLEGLSVPRGVIVQEGADLEVLSASNVRVKSVVFTEDHVGHILSIRNSSLGNDGDYAIVALVSPQELELEATTLSVEAAILVWEQRERTGLGDDFTRVDTNVPSLLKHLASNYGLTIDNLEVEARQRNFVRHVELWTALTAHVDGFRLLANIAGFDLELMELYHISYSTYLNLSALFEASAAYYAALTDFTVLELGITGLIYDGEAGELTLGPRGRIRLEDEDYTFTEEDVGKVVRVENSAEAGNNQLYEITSWIDDHTIEFALRHSGTFPDASIVSWRFVDFYTTFPPLRPLFDEINYEQLRNINPGTLTLDMYCWENDTTFRVGLDVVSVTESTTSGRWVIRVAGQATPLDPEVVSKTGNWVFEDNNAIQYYLDTLPVDVGGGEYTFEVSSTEEPDFTNPEGTLEYLCKPQFSCDYCQTSEILVRLTPQGVLEDGSSTERLFERMFNRLDYYMKPSRSRIVKAVKLPVGLVMPFSAKVEV